MAARNPGLCDSCQVIDIADQFLSPEAQKPVEVTPTRFWYRHHNSVQDLKRAVEEHACLLCQILYQAISDHENRDPLTVVDDWEYLDDDFDEDEVSNDSQVPHKLNPSTSYEQQADTNALQNPILLEFCFRTARHDELQNRACDVRVYWTHGSRRVDVGVAVLVTDLDDDLEEICTKRDIRRDTSTESTYTKTLSRKWLKACRESHEICKARRATREIGLPTRVIDVNEMRLVIASPGTRKDYVCLSHCWGKSRPLTTETKTLPDRCAGLDMTAMPKTFCDAIQITRDLGLQYLWIDSLCIIQDSAEDWARESAVMGKIYRDAAVTVFAEHADSDEGGLFFPRSGLDMALIRTPMFDGLITLANPGRKSRSFVQKSPRHLATHSMPKEHHIFETVRSLEKMSTKSLNSRGWVLQETILSCRSLIFDQHEARWHCPEMRACECLPEGHQRQSWLTRDREDVGHRELFNAWSGIVQEFTGRNLTYGKDKLPALAGLAGEMQKYNGGKYLAGLWEHTLRQDLIWFVRANSVQAPARSTSRSDRAPTWSWASIDGSVTPYFWFRDQVSTENTQRVGALECEILECNTKVKSEFNIFGEVSSGKLSLRGRMGKGILGPSTVTYSRVERLPLQDLDGKAVGWIDSDVLPSPLSPGMEIHCMPVFSDWDVLKCLALVPHGQKGGQLTDKVWQRVGLVSALPGDALISWLEEYSTVAVIVV